MSDAQRVRQEPLAPARRANAGTVVPREPTSPHGRIISAAEFRAVLAAGSGVNLPLWRKNSVALALHLLAVEVPAAIIHFCPLWCFSMVPCRPCSRLSSPCRRNRGGVDPIIVRRAPLSGGAAIDQRSTAVPRPGRHGQIWADAAARCMRMSARRVIRDLQSALPTFPVPRPASPTNRQFRFAFSADPARGHDHAPLRVHAPLSRGSISASISPAIRWSSSAQRRKSSAPALLKRSAMLPVIS